MFIYPFLKAFLRRGCEALCGRRTCRRPDGTPGALAPWDSFFFYTIFKHEDKELILSTCRWAQATACITIQVVLSTYFPATAGFYREKGEERSDEITLIIPIKNRSVSPKTSVRRT